MIPLSNELAPSAFVTNPEIDLTGGTSPEIRFTVHKPAKSPTPRKISSLTLVAFPRDIEIGGWGLKSVLLVQVRRVRKGFVANIWLEGAAEYGTGVGETEAISDLIVSLGEYRESLQRREATLGDSAQRELDCLRKLIERRPGNLS